MKPNYLSLDINEILQCEYEGITYYEEWKPIKDYEGIYEISSFGRVKSLERYVNHPKGKRLVKARILKLCKGTHGYLIVVLKSNNTGKTCLVHRLVALTFINIKNTKPNVNHRDGVKIYNFVGNLEFCTQHENIQHSINTGLTNNTGEDHTNSKITDEIVRNIREEYQNTKITQEKLGDKYGINHRTVSYIINRKLWKHVK